MQLSRRDALAALAAGGVAIGAGATAVSDGTGDAGSGRDGTTGEGGADASGEPTGALADHERKTLVAVARVVYPSGVTSIETFVETYADGRTSDRPAYVSGVSEAVRRLDALGEEWHGDRFVDLDPGAREQLLREIGVDTAEPAPDGSPAERIRHYLVNELLFALYSSPTGGELVGIENPQGHPGGLASYQRGPSQS